MQFISDDLLEYSISKSSIPDKICAELEAYTREHISHSQMLIGRMEASFLQFMIHAIGARTILEIGTYTGYSALAMASALPADGELTTLDVDAQNGKVAQSFWQRSPHGQKIRQILGPALSTIPNLPGPFDLIFIDADKENYLTYLQLSLDRLSPRGIIILDNVLWSGKVLDAKEQNSSTVSIRQVNDYLATLKGVHVTLLPVRDGVFLVKPLPLTSKSTGRTV